MQQTKLIMGMPITIEVVDQGVLPQNLEEVFRFFRKVDAQFSPYKKTSEVSMLNRKELEFSDVSPEMEEILTIAKTIKEKTNGYFDVTARGFFDPSGVVKGWAIKKAAEILSRNGFQNFFVDAGGDIQVSGLNAEKKQWSVGIRHPFAADKIVKTVRITGGIATSGTYLRGDHIYDPHRKGKKIEEIVSLSVIAHDVLTADLYATAAFAMGKKGIFFIEEVEGLEGYMIEREGMATYTSGFEKYVERGLTSKEEKSTDSFRGDTSQFV